MTGAGEKRTVRLTVRLTPAERRRVDRRAASCRLSTSAYVRGVVLDVGPRRRRHAAARSTLRRLHAVLLDVDELARQARDRDAPEIEDGLLELRETVHDIVTQLAALVREDA